MDEQRGGVRRTNVWRATGIKDESPEVFEFMSLSGERVVDDGVEGQVWRRGRAEETRQYRVVEKKRIIRKKTNGQKRQKTLNGDDCLEMTKGKKEDEPGSVGAQWSSHKSTGGQ